MGGRRGSFTKYVVHYANGAGSYSDEFDDLAEAMSCACEELKDGARVEVEEQVVKARTIFKQSTPFDNS